MAAVPISTVMQESGKASPELKRMVANAEEASDFLKSLAHGNRLMLLCLLAEKERSVTELEQFLQLRQPAVSQQLARLRLDGLVTTRREGKAIYYSIADERTKGFIRLIYETFCK
jgi:DNA-binding transcriptional ArsR family regulator